MKKRILLISVIFVSLLCSNFLFAQEAKKPSTVEAKFKWYTFEEAHALNKKNPKSPKKIFVDVYTDWCGWCKKMDAETFANPVIADYMNDHFYCVKLDAERKDTIMIDGIKLVNPNPTVKRSTHQLANELLRNQMSYPSYVFLNEKGESITVVPGFHQAKEFEAILSYFGSDAYLTTKWEDYIAKFQGKLK
jgi:thioredoxin-related protein